MAPTHPKLTLFRILVQGVVHGLESEPDERPHSGGPGWQPPLDAGCEPVPGDPPWT
jgi:hypothetical protein